MRGQGSEIFRNSTLGIFLSILILDLYKCVSLSLKNTLRYLP